MISVHVLFAHCPECVPVEHGGLSPIASGKLHTSVMSAQEALIAVCNCGE